MTSTRLGFVVLLAALLVGSACGDDGTSPDGGGGDGGVGEPENCDNGVDDDLDGDVDCDDVDCVLEMPGAGAGETLDAPFRDRVRFLYEGGACAPLQRDVAAGALDDDPLSVVTGSVRGDDGEPLAGVEVSVLGHPEWGRTASRRDGRFELALLGGGRRTLRLTAEGHLESQRSVVPRPEDYTEIAPVELVALGPATTVTPMEGGAVVSPRESDESGERGATALFLPGTAASLRMPDGSTAPLSALTIRPREVTVGPRGPARMSATLPAASGYTYAIDFDTADVPAGADVVFDQPVPIYVEDFLGMPVGTPVPVGSYDRALGRWDAEDDGRVIRVLAVNGGLADIDVDGDDVADDAAALAALGIDDAERRALASAHGPGATLWRFAATHFSLWDANWPFGLPDDAIDVLLALLGLDGFFEDACANGSEIHVERQVLGEAVSLLGTGMSLHYTSDRHLGYRATRSVVAQITPEAIPASLREVHVELAIAGTTIRESLTPTPGLVYRHAWDGLDRFGRRYRGAAPYVLRVGYAYEGVYMAPGDSREGPSFGSGGGRRIEGSRTREEIVVWREVRGTVSLEDVRTDGFLGLTLSAHHRLERGNETLLRGDGRTVSGRGIPRVVRRIGGGISGIPADDGVPIADARFRSIFGLARAASGDVFVGDAWDNRIFRLEEDGTLSVFAGDGMDASAGDGGPARGASLLSPRHLLMGPEGSLYVAEPYSTVGPDGESGGRIRRIAPDGNIYAFAGTGGYAPSSARNGLDDGLPAVDARLENVGAMAFASDGSLYFLDGGGTIRYITPTGLLRTENPLPDLENPEGLPLRQAWFGVLNALAIDAEDNLYVGDSGGKVFRMGADRIVRRVAGGGTEAVNSHALPALDVDLGRINSLLAHEDGLYIGALEGRMYLLDAAGNVSLVAGNVADFPGGNGGPATAATFFKMNQLVASDGGILLTDDSPSNQLREIRRSFGTQRAGEWVVPSSDGALRYIFDATGRHLRTETSLTGALVLSFEYDDEGHLSSVEDQDGNRLVVERRADRVILTPTEGPATSLWDDDEDGFADRITTEGDPHQTTLSFSSDGLLERFVDRIGVAHTFGYDDAGLLETDGVEGRATQTLSRDGNRVTLTSASGREGTWETHAEGTVRDQTYTNSLGMTVQRTVGVDGTVVTSYDDGSSLTHVMRPDVVLGGAVQVPARTTLRTPGGREVTWALDQSATMDAERLERRVAHITAAVGTSREATLTEVLAVAPTGEATFTVTSAAGRVGTMVRNARGEVERITQPGRHPVTFTYDGSGRLSSAEQGDGVTSRRLDFELPALPSATFGDLTLTDSLGQRVTTRRDVRGRAVESADALGSLHVGYDEAARRMTIAPPGAEAHAFTLNSFGQLTGYAPPDVPGGGGGRTYEWDDDDEPRAMTTGGMRIAFDIDDGYRPRSADLGGGRRGEIDYSPAGDPSVFRWVQPLGTVSVTPSYDGPLVTRVDVVGPYEAAVTPTYDDALEVSALTFTAGGESSTLAFETDADGLLDAVTATHGSTHRIVLTPDSVSGDLRRTRVGGSEAHFSYDGFGATEVADYTWPGGTLVRAYTPDAVGRIAEVTEAGSTDGYGYDARGRLERVFRGSALRYQYGYDGNGNRTSWATPSGRCDDPGGTGRCVEVDAQDRLLRYGEVGPGAIDFTYDAGGQLATRSDAAGTTRYTYDAVGHLVEVVVPSGRRIEYVIGPDGGRVARQVDGVQTDAWLRGSGGRIVGRIDASGRLEITYIYVGGSWVPSYALHRDGRLFRIVTDQVGSVRTVVNVDSGVVAQRYTYSPFGVLEVDVTTESIVPHRFAGGLYDPDTGLLRFGARDYDPELGRFTAKDPIGFAGGDPNLYAYAGNDPINGADPTGLFVDTLLDAIAIGGCAFAILRDNVFGSCGNFTANAQRCAMAAAAFVVPFVAYGALRATGRLGRRLARRAADPPCGGGVCPCFVAGTLVATGLVAGAPAEALTHQSIEALEVGDRVITAATLRDGPDETFDTAVTADWQVIDLEVAGDDETGKSKVVAITVLRPPGWLDAEDPDGDGAFELSLAELRLRGLAHVVHVRGPPHIAEGPGRVVLATVEHVADDVVALTFVAEDYQDDDAGAGSTELRATPNHPFWSLQRRAWVAAGELAIGEAVETARGVHALVARESVPGAHRVYNLSVERDAEYLVGGVGARVHNTYPGGGSRGAGQELRVLGRQADTAVAESWPRHRVLNDPNWTLARNDSWVAEGIANRQAFYMASPRARNMVQTSGRFAGQPTVYARELGQLQGAGYQRVGDYMVHPDDVASFVAP